MERRDRRFPYIGRYAQEFVGRVFKGQDGTGSPAAKSASTRPERGKNCRPSLLVRSPSPCGCPLMFRSWGTVNFYCQIVTNEVVFMLLHLCVRLKIR